MNKKKIGALLVGATLLVGAMGSFAYFTHKTSDILGKGGSDLQTITITNGDVEISAQVAKEGEALSDWTYDVARLSSKAAKLTVDENFENMHRSPDITVNSAKTANNDTTDTIPRAVIGSALPEEIKYTRPGDAIVLGTAQSGKDLVGGLVITNESNLTVRVRLVAKKSDDNKASKQLKAMEDAGWELYIDGTKRQFSDLEGGKVDIAVVGPNGQTAMPDIRFELPLYRDNKYQKVVAGGETEGAINLSEIIEIQATQENNHNWDDITQDNYDPQASSGNGNTSTDGETKPEGQ